MEMHNKGCPEEYPVTLIVNGYEVAVFQLTNQDLEDWTYGYLFSEGLIDNADDIVSLHVDEEFGEIRVGLNSDMDAEMMLNKRKHYTAGCGRGVTFFSMTDVKSFDKVTSNKTYRLSYLLKKQAAFAKSSPLYLETGGMHGACILDEAGDMVIREDIGRHNAVDKVIGYGVRNHMNADSLVLLTTGRISYEMLSKAAKFGFATVGSRTAATKQAIQLAKFLNIEVVGYLRGKMAIIYTSKDRVINDVSDSGMGAEPNLLVLQ
jgi:FdhD protein